MLNTEWNQELQERVGQPTKPERIQSLLVIVPGASGDVALSTTVIRYVKQINPQCRVIFATKRANIAVAQLCPGIAEIIELPNEAIGSLSRRRSLSQFAGFAEAVVYPSCVSEDIDLLKHCTLLETLWLLSGVEGGMPREPQQVWLEANAEVESASAVVGRSLAQHPKLMRAAARHAVQAAKDIARPRTLRGSGVRKRFQDLALMLRHGLEAASPRHTRRLQRGSLSKSFVILSTQANSLSGPPLGVTDTLIRALRRDGRTVLHNVLDPYQAARGTVPLICSYAEFLALRQAGMPFVGWRSGLCDIAAASPAPMCVLYPAAYEWSDEPISTFGFNTMNVVAKCYEFVCRSVDDVVRSGFVAQLREG